MIAALTNHLWQSTVFVLAAWLVAAALRQNGAHVRHRIWLIASVKFLVPFSLLISLGSMLPSFAPAATTGATLSAPDLSVTVDQIAEPFTSDVFLPSAPVTAQAVTNWMAILAGAWACGFVLIVFMRLRDWRRVRTAVRASVPAPLQAPVPVRAAPGLLEPGVVGLFRPVLLVPAGIELQLTPKQLEAVLVHELCHVTRRDNLTSAIHMVVEAVFWFHPLVWFIGARLVDERERACDEHVLRVCGEPTVYAESILNVCKLYVESPIACVSGVSGADLKKRIAAIMINRVGLRLNVTRKAALVLAAVLAIGLPVIAGALTPDGGRISPAPVIGLAEGPAQTAAAQVRKFEVASVKPCAPDSPPPPGRSGGAGQGSSDYLYLPCQTLRQLVSRAYLYNQQDHLKNRVWEEKFVPGFPPFIRGGPSWADDDKFTIEAKADAATDQYTLTGPMMRALLEDRFQLKTHRATEERSMYALTVAKSGLKIKPTSPGDCYEFDPDKPVPPHGKDTGPCGYFSGNGWGTSQAHGVMLGESGRDGERFVNRLWVVLLQPVLDRTGLNGRYTFDFDFTPDENTPGVNGRCNGNADCMARLADKMGISDERPATFKSTDTIFKAVEKLGLKLEKVKAPAEYLVIDSAERPRPNSPAPVASNRGGFGATGQPVAMLAVMQSVTSATAQTSPSRFDVVSVKPCEPNAPHYQGRAGGGPPITSPGRLYLQCYPLYSIFAEAYISFAGGRGHGLTAALDVGVEGGPDWMKSERYTIEAQTGQAAPAAVMRGPMLQTVLEDRFKLKVRRVTREMPVYELVIAKSGAKVAPYTGSDCMIRDYAVWPPATLPAGQRYCGDQTRMEGDRIIRAGVLSLDELSSLLGFDRPVINRTGITAAVSYRLEFDRQEAMAGEAPRPSLVSALRNQLGLDLRESKGPRDFLVIDHVERPSPNFAAFAAASGNKR